MGHVVSIANAVTAVFLLPGDIACDALGVRKSNNRYLLRMLVNSLGWAFVGALVVGFLI